MLTRTVKWTILSEPLVAGSAGHRLLNFILDKGKVEARARLHGREVDGGLCQFGDFLLDKDEPPEFECPPVSGEKGVPEVHLLERVETKVVDPRPIQLDFWACNSDAWETV